MHPDERRFALLPRVTEIAALIAAAIGALALVGWLLDVPFLTHLAPSAPPMEPDTALAVILLGGSLWLGRDRRAGDDVRAWSRGLAIAATAIGLLALAEEAFDVQVGLDGLLDGEAAGAAPHAGLAIVIYGLWLAALDRSGRWETLATGLTALSGLVVLAAAIGIIYGADYVYGNTGSAGIAPQTVVAIAALFIGLLAARPDNPWMRLVLSPGTGGHVMRRLIPALILLPILAGGLLIAAIEAELVSITVGVAFTIAGLTAALLAILVLISRELEEADSERLNLQARLVELADRDPLTDVFNRRRLDEELRRQLAIAERTGTRLGALSIDLDGFKAVNDGHGHPTGDELLLATAAVLRNELRASDFICRPGGDEFIVLLPDSDEETVRVVADKLIEAFRRVERPTPSGEALVLRASIGVALTEADGWGEPEDLLHAADRALYAAKQAGGDRVALDGSLVLD